MRIGENDFFHLTYCSNIHPGEHWNEIFHNLENYILPLKASLSPDKSFGIGLRLSDKASRELLSSSALIAFKDWLSHNNLYVFTINGFVYDHFHHKLIKEKVYQPDWTTSERRDYSLRLVKILTALTPPGSESGFSTSPLSYKPWLDASTKLTTFRTATFSLMQVVAEMVRINEGEGKSLHIDIEPEPDCLIATTEEAIFFFKEWLFFEGASQLASLLKVSPNKAEAYIRKHVRLCYDICHFSIEYEDHTRNLRLLKEAGIEIGKVQVRSALKVHVSNDKDRQQGIIQNLTSLTASPYLHQVIIRDKHGNLSRYEDLIKAIPDFSKMAEAEWRIHFHVPLFLEKYDTLHSTQNDVKTVLNLIQENKATSYLEIETYTWDVLPPSLKEDLKDSLQREYEWVLQNFKPKD